MVVAGSALLLLGVGLMAYLVWRNKDFEELAEDLYEEVRPVPRKALPLEEEIRDVSLTLVDSIGRLREVFLKAEAFEHDVKDLVRKAEDRPLSG
jgi:hypothetical protein